MTIPADQRDWRRAVWPARPRLNHAGAKPRRGLDRWLVVMVKAATAGRVKTRLARGIGAGRAASFYRTGLAIEVRRLSAPGRWRLVLAVTPDGEISSAALPPGTDRCGQGAGDLGARMQSVFDSLPPGPVVIVGSDCPGLTAAHVAAAFRALGRADVVMAPSPDGGYGLIGLARRRRVPHLFRGVRWSHEKTRADTLANAAGLAVILLAELADVDEADDLVRADLKGLIGRLVIGAAARVTEGKSMLAKAR
ncbi:MAG: TIGR04282 family arsenosugar biosynthesis glycosyltransferase [Hyphomicrobiaceae bacterium]|nr:TIGR04282 family arsenosugar biosynthesis glycosyltransferase [Hyphomicrobiaceae bacterium]